MNSVRLGRLVSVCVDLAEKAGRVIKDGALFFHFLLAVRMSGEVKAVSKNSAGTLSYLRPLSDPQTIADIQAQLTVTGGLKRVFPTLKMIGEEDDIPTSVLNSITGECPESFLNRILHNLNDDILKPFPHVALDETYNVDDLSMWIDPLDSTESFTKGDLYPVTVMIGVAHRGVPIAGIIHYPFHSRESVVGVVGAGVLFGRGTNFDENNSVSFIGGPNCNRWVTSFTDLRNRRERKKFNSLFGSKQKKMDEIIKKSLSVTTQKNLNHREESVVNKTINNEDFLKYLLHSSSLPGSSPLPSERNPSVLRVLHSISGIPPDLKDAFLTSYGHMKHDDWQKYMNNKLVNMNEKNNNITIGTTNGNYNNEATKKHTFLEDRLNELGAQSAESSTHHTHNNPIHFQGMAGAGHKLNYLLHDDADVSVSRIVSLWDSCAGHACITALGGVMTDLRGDGILYDPEVLYPASSIAFSSCSLSPPPTLSTGDRSHEWSKFFQNQGLPEYRSWTGMLAVNDPDLHRVIVQETKLAVERQHIEACFVNKKGNIKSKSSRNGETVSVFDKPKEDTVRDVDASVSSASADGVEVKVAKSWMCHALDSPSSPSPQEMKYMELIDKDLEQKLRNWVWFTLVAVSGGSCIGGVVLAHHHGQTVAQDGNNIIDNFSDAI